MYSAVTSMITNTNKINAFIENVSNYNGDTVVIENDSSKLTSKTYKDTTMYLCRNPHLNDDCHSPHLLLSICQHSPNSLVLFNVWMPHNGDGKIVITTPTCMTFVNFFQMAPYGTSTITFKFKFANNQYYWLNDDPGSELRGWKPRIIGSKDDQKVYGHTEEANLQACLVHVRPFLNPTDWQLNNK